MADFKDLLFKVHHLKEHKKHYALIIARVYIDGNYTLSLPEDDVDPILDADGGTISLTYRLSTNGASESGVNRLVTVFKHVEIIDPGQVRTEPQIRADIGTKLYDITCQVWTMDGETEVTNPKTGQISKTSTIIID